MKTYNIQEFSKRSGISVDRLRHFEKHGNIIPERNPDNQYRMYTDLDLVDAQVICSLQSMKFQLNNINPYEHQCTPEMVTQSIRSKISSLESQIDILEKQLHMMRLIEARMPEMISQNNSSRNWRFQPRYVLYYDEAYEMGNHELISNWMMLMPFVSSCLTIPASSFESGNEQLEARLGLQLVTYHEKTLPIFIEPPVHLLPERMGVRGVAVMKNPLRPQRSELQSLIDYLRISGQKPVGDWVFSVKGMDYTDSGKCYYTRVMVGAQPIGV